PDKFQQYLRTQIGHIAVIEGENTEWREETWREQIIFERYMLVATGKPPRRSDHYPDTLFIQYKQADHYLNECGYPSKRNQSARHHWIEKHAEPLLRGLFAVQCSCVYPDLIPDSDRILERHVTGSPVLSSWLQNHKARWEDAADDGRKEFLYSVLAS